MAQSQRSQSRMPGESITRSSTAPPSTRHNNPNNRENVPSTISSSQASSQQQEEHFFAREEEVVSGRNGKKTRRHHCHCGRHFTSRKALVNHVHTEKYGKPFKCRRCVNATRFSTHRNLKKHMQKVHDSFDYGNFGCHGCGLEFGTAEELTRHRKFAGHAVVKLGKAKVGPAPPSNQPKISNFFRVINPTLR